MLLVLSYMLLFAFGYTVVITKGLEVAVDEIYPHNFTVRNLCEFGSMGMGAIPLLAPLLAILLFLLDWENNQTPRLILFVLIILTITSFFDAVNGAYRFYELKNCINVQGRYTRALIYPAAVFLLNSIAMFYPFSDSKREV